MNSPRAAAAPPAYRDQTVGRIAATLPGATAIFRRARIDFCCGGDLVLGEAARARGLDLASLEASLQALAAQSTTATPPGPTEALVAHIRRRYHDTHRRELPELVRLARKVEAVHRDHPAAPAGLADEIEGLRLDLEEHMTKEEQVLFPALVSSGQGVDPAIEQMRREHRHHGARLERLEEIAHEFEPPTDACRSWCVLYSGTGKLVEDLREHIHLENNVLFPRFEGA